MFQLCESVSWPEDHLLGMTNHVQEGISTLSHAKVIGTILTLLQAPVIFLPSIFTSSIISFLTACDQRRKTDTNPAMNSATCADGLPERYAGAIMAESIGITEHYQIEIK